jgi:hypothetical protein
MVKMRRIAPALRKRINANRPSAKAECDSKEVERKGEMREIQQKY